MLGQSNGQDEELLPFDEALGTAEVLTYGVLARQYPDRFSVEKKMTLEGKSAYVNCDRP